MKKIILAATGEELEWRDDEDEDPCLVRKSYLGVLTGVDRWEHILVALYQGSPEIAYVGHERSCRSVDGRDRNAVEQFLVEEGLIRIIDEAEPQPGPSREEYLITEAEAIIKDVARTSSGRDSLDAKRALAFLVDLQDYRSSK